MNGWPLLWMAWRWYYCGMRTFLLSFLLLSACSAQTVTVTPRNKTPAKSVSVVRVPRLTLASFTCDRVEFEPGDSSTCTITLSGPARAGGFISDVVVPSGFTGPGVVTVLVGALSVSFEVTAVDEPLAGAVPVFPTALTVTVAGVSHTTLEMLVPCCARADKCGLPVVSMLPCGL